MKRVSFNAAKVIKEAGYPQDYKNAEDTYTNLNGGIWVKPTYLEVWLWLWREKKVGIDISFLDNGKVCSINSYYPAKALEDPEEAIIEVVEYLVENNLIYGNSK